MKRDQLHVLIQKYFLGTITEIEKKRLEDWYSSYEEPAVWELEADEEIQTVKNRILQKVLTETESEDVKKRSNMFYAVRVAAVLLVIAITGFVVSRYVANVDSNIIANVPNQQQENRYLLLPDSSVVLLRPGSTISYVNDFKGNTREVKLKGEAYFDIKSRPSQPFIIHSGDVKTTVLGTKFSIKTIDHANVSVSVREGKVKVENEKQLIAELTANQQVIYDQEKWEIKEQPLHEELPVFEWTVLDMRFDAMLFHQLTEKLERRYDVSIGFENNDLKYLPVSGKFVGTETLEGVLDVLCGTRNASHKRVKPNEILIQLRKDF